MHQGISLRELARRIDRSPSFLVSLELEDEIPAVAEETLAAIAMELALNRDQLVTWAGRTPRDVAPESTVEVGLYRIIKSIPDKEKQSLLDELERRYKTGTVQE